MVTLFGPKRHHRIDPRGAARRNVCGDERSRSQQQRDRRKGERIRRAHAEQEAAQRTTQHECAAETDRTAGHRDSHPLTHHQAEHRPLGGPERLRGRGPWPPMAQAAEAGRSRRLRPRRALAASTAPDAAPGRSSSAANSRPTAAVAPSIGSRFDDTRTTPIRSGSPPSPVRLSLPPIAIATCSNPWSGFDIEVLTGRKPVFRNVQAGRTIPQDYQPVCVLVWKRMQQEGARDTEYRRIRADPDREREDRRGCEARILREAAKCIPHVVQKHVGPATLLKPYHGRLSSFCTRNRTSTCSRPRDRLDTVSST